MLYRVTFLNDNGWAITHETVEATSPDDARRLCQGNHPMGRVGRVITHRADTFGPPEERPTFDRKTGRYTWPERKEA